MGLRYIHRKISPIMAATKKLIKQTINHDFFIRTKYRKPQIPSVHEGVIGANQRIKIEL